MQQKIGFMNRAWNWNVSLGLRFIIHEFFHGMTGVVITDVVGPSYS
jgi:hypothetical protein